MPELPIFRQMMAELLDKIGKDIGMDLTEGMSDADKDGLLNALVRATDARIQNVVMTADPATHPNNFDDAHRPSFIDGDMIRMLQTAQDRYKALNKCSVCYERIVAFMEYVEKAPEPMRMEAIKYLAFMTSVLSSAVNKLVSHTAYQDARMKHIELTCEAAFKELGRDVDFKFEAYIVSEEKDVERLPTSDETKADVLREYRERMGRKSLDPIE
jgi:hypothetical protein